MKLTYNSRYQNLHMDRANINAMKTVNVTVTSNLPNSSTPILLHRYAHGYSYIPQVWGLWDIHYSSALGNGSKRGYGTILHNTGIGLTCTFYYTVDATYVNCWLIFNTTSTPPPATSGMTAKFTGYVFANDLTAQDYTA